MLLSTKYLALTASALFLTAVPTLAAEETPAAPHPVAPTATVKCPGVTNIPMTADAEQALPLHLVGTLSCGEPVYVLGDTEGYTAHIRTADGKDGYVARMYLTAESSASMQASQAVPSAATPVNGVVRWSAGAPGCDEFISHGRYVESITAKGVTVQVSLQDTGWKYRATIAVSNQTDAPVSVTPAIITLDELQPNLRALYAADTDKIAHTSTHQALWTVANAVPSPSAVVPGPHRNSESDRLANRTNPTPDYLSPQLSLASAHPAAFARSESIDIDAISLKSAAIPPTEKTAGVMWFSRDSATRELSLRVPAGDVVFDFSFSFELKNKPL